MRHYLDDDAGYLAWTAAHPHEYVLNTERSPNPNYLRLHRAACRMINGMPANGRHWTLHYRKVCGTRAELESYAASVGGAVWVCPLCH